jgi:Leucine Rich repeat
MGCGCSRREDPQEVYRRQQLEILTPKDREEALNRIAATGVSINNAIEQIADAYFHAYDGRQRDISKALMYYHHLLETSVNSRLRQKIGSYYEEGYQVEKNESKAWEYYLQIYEFHKACRLDRFVSLASTQKWEELGAGALEPALRSNAIRLVDAAWLCRSYQIDGLRKVPRRQDMPEEAFLSANEVIQATRGGEIDVGLRVRLICLSYMWLDEEHPDPFGWTFNALVEKLKEMVRLEMDGGQNCSWAVFWDFPSLFQQPRSEEEDFLFRQGLDALAGLYSHQFTLVFKVTAFPPSYPKGYPVEHASPAQRKHATTPYERRGWPFTESCWAGWTKSGEKTIDLSHQIEPMNEEDEADVPFSMPQKLLAEGIDEKYVDLFYTLFLEKIMKIPRFMFEQSGIEDKIVQAEQLNSTRLPVRDVALLPDNFCYNIEDRSFTNKKKDAELVVKLYHDGFCEKFAQTDVLNYSRMEWGDKQVCQLANIIATGMAPNIRKVFLDQNLFGAEGARALAQAMTKLTSSHVALSLMYNLTLRDEGVKALSPAFGCLHSLCLEGTFIGLGACEVFRDAFLHETCSLRILNVSGNPMIGDRGCELLSEIAFELEVMEMANCEIGDEGCSVLLQSIGKISSKNSVRRLKQLNLRGNKFGDKMATPFLQTVRDLNPPLEKLDVSNTGMSDSELGGMLQIGEDILFFKRRFSDG